MGSIEFIHRQAIARRDSGIAILLVSAELDEVLEMSDRIGVMFRGQLVAVLDGRTADREDVGLLMATGGRGGGRPAADPGGCAVTAAAAPARRPLGRRILDVTLLPAIAIGLALIFGAVLMILSSPLIRGFDLFLPITAYKALLEGSVGSLNSIVNTLVNATPLVLAGLAVGIGFKGGLFNIGAQGQFLLGALCASVAAIALNDASPWVAIPVSLIAGMLGGMAWGFIPGFLKAFTGAHEVVTTIMLNFVAI